MQRMKCIRKILATLLILTMLRTFTMPPEYNFEISQHDMFVPVSHKNHSMLFVHVGKTGGETIKWRLKVICKIRGSKRKKERCYRQFQETQESRLSQSTIGYTHCGSIRPRLSMSNITTFLFSIRDPVVSTVCYFNLKVSLI